MQELIIALGTALAKNLTGWLKNSLEDQQISEYEWLKLGETILVTGAITLGAYFAWTWMDAPFIDALTVGTGWFFGSLYDAWKNRKKK